MVGSGMFKLNQIVNVHAHIQTHTDSHFLEITQPLPTPCHHHALRTQVDPHAQDPT